MVVLVKDQNGAYLWINILKISNKFNILINFEINVICLTKTFFLHDQKVKIKT